GGAASAGGSPMSGPGTAGAPPAPLLEMRNVTKRFGAFEALKGVDFDLYPGEVHALLGENGAGKSTLMKIVAGVQPATSGTLRVGGEEVAFRGVGDAQAHGVAMVYQELALATDLSVAENLFLGRLEPFVSHRRLAERARPLLEQVDLDVPPLTPLGALAVGEQQLRSGEEVAFRGVGDAQAHGVAMVYQELALATDLSVAENLFLGRLEPFVSHRRLAERARPLLEQVDLDVPPLTPLGALAVGEQQLVEIARALGQERRVLVFDEPTAALSSAETERLFGLIRRLKERGVGI